MKFPFDLQQQASKQMRCEKAIRRKEKNVFLLPPPQAEADLFKALPKAVCVTCTNKFSILSNLSSTSLSLSPGSGEEYGAFAKAFTSSRRNFAGSTMDTTKDVMRQLLSMRATCGLANL